MVVEDKGLSATLHFRNAPDPEAGIGEAQAALLAAAVPGVELRRGRMSLELRPAGRGDKGTALEELVRRHELRGLVVVGDDVTDLDMFRTAARLRSSGELAAAILAVRGGREVPHEVSAAADATLASPDAVVALLRSLVSGRAG
jgi:trehalose 6-phosphate phosphatase